MTDRIPANVQDLVSALRVAVRAGLSFELTVATIPENLREAVLDEYYRQRVPIADAAVITGDQPHADWSGTFNSAEGLLWGQLRRYLLEYRNRSDSEIASLDDASDKILYLLGDPKSPNFDRRGLAVGYVQSGKTANYTALSAKAFDAGYKLVIVLSGIHNSLRRQTQLRMERELGMQMGDTEEPTSRDFSDGTAPVIHQLTSSDLRAGDFLYTTIGRTILTDGDSGRFLVVTKKNGHVLRRLIAWLGENLDVPVLIIDDEADQAGVNTGGNNVGATELESTETEDESPSVINALIRQLRSRFSRVSYVAYTATPFANVFVRHDAQDFLVGDDLYPRDFIISLSKPRGYLGPEEFFGSAITGNASEATDIAGHVIQIVHEDEAAELSALNPHDDNEDMLPSGLKDAIRFFLLALCARRIKTGEIRASSMLIHSSSLTSEQETLARAVEGYLSGLRREWRWSRDEPHVVGSWMDDWTRFISNMPDDEYRFDFEQIKGMLGDVLGRFAPISVLLLNNASEDELDYEAYPDLNAIVVGGNKLSRGLTLEGLLVSYFIRGTKNPNADTLLQMGRFFGYSLDRVSITRIFTTAKLRDDFREISAMEVMLRGEIARYERENLTPADFAPRVLHTRIRPTARNKMRDALLTGESYSGNLIQTTSFVVERPGTEPEHMRNSLNVALVDGFVKDLAAANPGVLESRLAEDNKLCFTGVDAADILTFLRSFQTGESNTRFKPEAIISYIEDLNQFGALLEWSVAIVGRRIEPRLGYHSFGQLGDFGRLERALDSGSDRSIGQLINPINETSAGGFIGDEVLDFSGEEIAAATGLLQVGLKPAQAARQTRPESRGLLAIYPISPFSKGDTPGKDNSVTLGQSILSDVKLDLTIMGLAMVFPHVDSIELREYWRGTAGRNS